MPDCKGWTISTLVSGVIKSADDQMNLYGTTGHNDEFTQTYFTFRVTPVVGIA